MRTSEIAKRYLDYFSKHDHLVMPSASLISPNPTTLFTIAGMVPFIPYLLGEQTPPHKRMASNQKCCLLYTSPSPRDGLLARMPSSA